MWVMVKGPGELGPFGGASFTIEQESDVVIEADGTLRVSSINPRNNQRRSTVFAKGAWSRYTTGTSEHGE